MLSLVGGFVGGLLGALGLWSLWGREARSIRATLDDLDSRVRALEWAEDTLVRLVLRTYQEPDPEASVWSVPPVEEQIVMSVSLAQLAQIFRYSAGPDGAEEISLLRPAPVMSGAIPMGGGQFFDVVLTRA